MELNKSASAGKAEQGDEHRHASIDDPSLSGPSAKSSATVRTQMLGESGVGKTCFLAGLALLNEQTDGHSFVLPTDNATKAVFDKLRDTLKDGRWPAKTSIVDELSFAIIRGRSRVDVQLSDFAGESFTDSMKRGNASEAAHQIQALISDADLLIVLLDGGAVDRKQDFTGAPLIQAVFERISTEGSGDLEAAVVLTKSDLCLNTPINTSDDLKRLVHDRAPDLSRFLQEQGLHTQWIPLSVCGPNATDESGSPIYASLAPQGYEAIFEQLFRRHNRPRNRRIRLWAAAAVFVLLMGIASVILRGQQVENQRQRIADRSIPTAEVAVTVSSENEPALRERYDEDFAKAKEDIEASGNIESIDLVLKRFEKVPATHESLVARSLERIRSQARDRKEQLLHKRIIDCQQLQTGDCAPLIEMYLIEFPDGPHADDMRLMLDNINQARYLTARGQVKAVPVTSTEALRKKIAAITDFLKDYGQLIDADEKLVIAAARDIASQLVTPRQYHCKLLRTSGIDGPRDHGVKILVNREQIANFDDSGDVTEKNWSREFTVDWLSGKPIQIVLVNYDGFNHDMAYFENDSPVAIVLLAGTNSPSRYSTGMFASQDFTKTRPPFKIAFECEELPPEKLKVISDYLLPGDKW
jgi:hypothetical protein